jgi:hypothetical protein
MAYSAPPNFFCTNSVEEGQAVLINKTPPVSVGSELEQAVLFSTPVKEVSKSSLRMSAAVTDVVTQGVVQKAASLAFLDGKTEKPIVSSAVAEKVVVTEELDGAAQKVAICSVAAAHEMVLDSQRHEAGSLGGFSSAPKDSPREWQKAIYLPVSLSPDSGLPCSPGGITHCSVSLLPDSPGGAFRHNTSPRPCSPGGSARRSLSPSSSRGTGAFLGGRYSQAEVLAFGGVPAAGIRSSDRIRQQLNADASQLNRAQGLAQKRDLALDSSNCRASKYTLSSFSHDDIVDRASKLGVNLGNSPSQILSSIDNLKDTDLQRTLIMLKKNEDKIKK